ncbi:hypothetical protein [Bacillus mycoides]|nr:hypothetical protein [Bacillus mycoides]
MLPGNLFMNAATSSNLPTIYEVKAYQSIKKALVAYHRQSSALSSFVF